jgi:hypothetical protein
VEAAFDITLKVLIESGLELQLNYFEVCFLGTIGSAKYSIMFFAESILSVSFQKYQGQYICKFCKYLIRLDAKHYLKLGLDLG